MILFLNKYDLLVKKIVEDGSKLEEYFPSYKYFETPQRLEQAFCVANENPEVTKAKMFILEQFLIITMSSDSNAFADTKFCIPYFTTAVDTSNIKKVFKACSHILKKEHLEKCGLIWPSDELKTGVW